MWKQTTGIVFFGTLAVAAFLVTSDLPFNGTSSDSISGAVPGVKTDYSPAVNHPGLGDKNYRQGLRQDEKDARGYLDKLHKIPTTESHYAIRDPELLQIMTDRNKSNKPIKDPDAFLQRLNEIKTSNIKEEELQNATSIFFSTIQPVLNDPRNDYKSVFSPHSLRIYAIFEVRDPPSLEKNSVFVKWHNSAKDLLFFEYVTINPNSSLNYIWREMPDWSPGYYNVDIYRSDETMTLLASGSYEIQELHEYFGSLALYAGVDYGYSENSFTTNQNILLKLNYSSLVDHTLHFKVTELADNSILYEQDFLLPTAYKWQKTIYLNDYVSAIPPGTYQIDAFDENNRIVARSIFYLVSKLL